MLRTSGSVRGFVALLFVALLTSGCGQETFSILGSFYDAPDPLPAAAHGDLIRSESVENSKDVRAWRLLFHSQDFEGRNIQSSGVLFVPRGQPPEGGWPLISLAHGTSGLPRNCAPSPLPFTPLAWSGGASVWDREASPYVYPESAGLEGYAVVMADYQGTGTTGPYSYLLGELTGKNVLDAALAAHGLLGDALSSQTFLWGHSQGGQAAGWAAQQASSYAPELSILGAILLAPAAELGQLLEAVLAEEYNVNQSSAAALVLTAVPGFALNYGLDTKTILSAAGEATQEGVKSVCLGTNLAVFETEAVLRQYKAADYLRLPGGEVPPRWLEAIEAQNLGQAGASLGAPTFLINGATDTVVPPEVTCSYFENTVCPTGDRVEFKIYPDTGHLDLPVTANADILQWMQDRLEGQEAPTNCRNLPVGCRTAP
ncbi:MAG: alpha/beta fold hydrolase [Candidatus Binatia bacterium]|nr:alpha/beta fold hydrolase [Candidatus Binatia bacterium]MDG2008575.1 alpha/beta fold hydrolase [Candidatus Binatia bacterium]